MVQCWSNAGQRFVCSETEWFMRSVFFFFWKIADVIFNQLKTLPYISTFYMPATSSCCCGARDYRHAHCFCKIYKCNGKAVSRSTYQNHRQADRENNDVSVQATASERNGEEFQITQHNCDLPGSCTSVYVF